MLLEKEIKKFCSRCGFIPPPAWGITGLLPWRFPVGTFPAHGGWVCRASLGPWVAHRKTLLPFPWRTFRPKGDGSAERRSDLGLPTTAPGGVIDCAGATTSHLMPTNSDKSGLGRDRGFPKPKTGSSQPSSGVLRTKKNPTLNRAGLLSHHCSHRLWGRLAFCGLGSQEK